MYRILIFLFCSCFFFSCTYDIELYDSDYSDSCNVVLSSDSIQSIIDVNCISCHGSTFPNGNLSLTDIQETESSIEDIIDRINRSDNDPKLMPPGNKLSDCKITQIIVWSETL